MTQDAAVIDYADRAEFYEIEYTDSADMPFLLAQIGQEVSSVLEAPCGVGRVTLPMAERGASITAVDIEPAMIETLARRARRHPYGERIEGVVADIRTARLHRTYDLVMSPAEGIQLFLDNKDLTQVVTTLARHVTHGGRLLLDCASFEMNVPSRPEETPGYFDPCLEDGREIEEWRRPLSDGGTLTRWRTQWNDGPVIRFDFRYERTGPTGSSHTFSSELELRRPDRDLIVAAAKDAGLVLDAIEGDRRGSPWEPGAPRMILRFHRPTALS